MSDEKVVHIDIQERERLVRLEGKMDDTRSDMKHLYRSFDEHTKDDTSNFMALRQELSSHSVSISELAEQVKNTNEIVTKMAHSQERLTKFMYICMGIFTCAATLIPAMWAILTFIVPLLPK